MQQEFSIWDTGMWYSGVCLIFARRYERGSLIVMINMAHADWGQVFQDERLAGALLDRLTHRCHIFEMKGESFRFRENMKTRGSATPHKRTETGQKQRNRDWLQVSCHKPRYGAFLTTQMGPFLLGHSFPHAGPFRFTATTCVIVGQHQIALVGDRLEVSLVPLTDTRQTRLPGVFEEGEPMP